MGTLPLEDIIRLRRNEKVPYIYDVAIEGAERLRTYSQVECHVVLYPYSRQVSSQDIAFYPFEEYVRDVLSRQRSAYAAIERQFNELFGLLLGAAIALVFARLKPAELFSIESIVSVFGAYLIGKELWDDIERALVGVSEDWRVRYQESDYRYRLEKHTTLTSYTYLGKRRRYGEAAWLPERVDLVKQSNSQTLRLCFDTRDLGATPGPSVHIHSIHVDPEQLGALEEEGFLFGVKLSLNQHTLGVTRSLELFQSIDDGVRGCLDEEGAWVEGAVFWRRTYSLGRLKFYRSSGVVADVRVVSCEVGRGRNLAKVLKPSQG
ncbi:MAG: hypothetical protein JXA09_07620 [Anaerolineae bacterium]|nr:hypothetical protein [Anaerolineae bacterium]